MEPDRNRQSGKIMQSLGGRLKQVAPYLKCDGKRLEGRRIQRSGPDLVK